MSLTKANGFALTTLVRTGILFFALILLGLLDIHIAGAQSWPLDGGRAVSRDGRWLAPVSSFLLSSDEDDHKRRGSVDAWDISAPYGTPIYPMGAGQVVYAGCNNSGGYGCWALIDHKNGYTSLYAHMIDEGAGRNSEGRLWVERGDIVSAWTPLGRLGWTGTTSFGPHVHWEIRSSDEGRIRIDSLFPRFPMDYCKFCAYDSEEAAMVNGGLRAAVRDQAAFGWTALASSHYMWLIVAILLLVGTLAKPKVPLRLAKSAGGYLLRSGRTSQTKVKRFRDTAAWAYVYLTLLIIVPALLCGSTSAVAVWMSDEGISPREVWRSLRFGLLSPLIGPRYETGLRYAAVWGTPCGQVGTLGQVCTEEEILAKGLEWREEVNAFTGSRPAFAIIPRINPRFSYAKARELIAITHEAGGLVIVDVEAELDEAEEVIQRLAPFGLDGIAIDIEYADIVSSADIERLAIRLAQERRAVGFRSDGLVIVWDVFHNVRMNSTLKVDGAQIIPIFTGYGSADTKIAGLTVSQKLFESSPSQSGLMAFDNRWPINQACRNFSVEQGFDCQEWRHLFSDPRVRNIGWWVQQ